MKSLAPTNLAITIYHKIGFMLYNIFFYRLNRTVLKFLFNLSYYG